MFSFPLRIVVDCFAICKETTQVASLYKTMRVASWYVEQTRNRPPFLPKQWFNTGELCILNAWAIAQCMQTSSILRSILEVQDGLWIK